MSFRLPDGLLDSTAERQNANDRVEYEKAFESGELETRKMAMALMCADPSTPENFIRANLTNPEMPPRYGYTDIEPTLDDVFSIGSARSRSSSPGSPQMGMR
jgi:hypothetical protein